MSQLICIAFETVASVFAQHTPTSLPIHFHRPLQAAPPRHQCWQSDLRPLFLGLTGLLFYTGLSVV